MLNPRKCEKKREYRGKKQRDVKTKTENTGKDSHLDIKLYLFIKHLMSHVTVRMRNCLEIKTFVLGNDIFLHPAAVWIRTLLKQASN